MPTLTAHCAEEWEYTVQAGDTLWALTERYLSDLSLVPQLQQLNGIGDPRQLQPGTRLRIPLAWMKTTPRSAQVVAVHGDVRIELASSGSEREAVAGATLHAGDIVRTRAGSHAAVEFFDGSVLSLHSDSTLLLDGLHAYAAGLNAVRVELPSGRAEARARAQPDETSRFEIETPAGITSVRGTDFRVSVPAGEKLSRTEVLTGEVVVASARRDVAVQAGYGTVVRAGEPPATPVALLPPPELAELPASLANLPLEIHFPAVSGAVAYRVQLARGSRFEQIVFDALSDAPSVRLPELPNGRYVLRARAVDVAGLEGRHAERVVELSARAAPPALIEPQDGAEVSAAPLSFRWDSPDSRLTYRLQVARDATFSEPIVDWPALRDSSAILEQALPSGVYYWRIAATHPERGEGPSSAVRTFRRPPPSPTVEPPTLAPRQIRLRWFGDRADRRYRVQLARDPEFTQVVIDTYVDDNALELPRPVAGRYFLRIRAVEADGYEGPYEPATSIDVHGPPAAPLPVQPADEAPVSSAPLEFRWEPAGASSSYRFQFADNPAFDPVYVDASNLTRPGFTLELPLAPGSYFWRVAASTRTDGEGEFSPTQTLRRLPSTPGPLTSTTDLWVLELRWQAGPAGQQYDVQLARDQGFQNLLINARVGQAELRIPRPPGGRYYVRLRALDADGFASPCGSVQSIDVRSRPRPPRLAEPQNGAVVPREAAQLSWHAQPGPVRYRVQLATDARFIMVLLDRRDLEGTTLAVGQRLEPGAYFWRVATTTEIDGEGAFSEARTLRVPPTAPELAPVEVVSDGLVFRWRDQSFSQQYHLQVATDGEFRNLIVDRGVSGAEFRMPRPAAGHYFARLRAEDADGVAGPYSTPRTVQIPARFPFWLLPLLPLLFVL